MVQDTITNAILIIAVVIATTVLVTAMYPALFNAAATVKSAAVDADDRAATSFTIVTCGYSGDYTRLDVWMKNTGDEKIAGMDNISVYFGDDSGSMKRYDIAASSVYSQDGTGSDWEPGETLTIGMVDSPSGNALPHDPGIHVIKITLPNGAESQYTFTI